MTAPDTMDPAGYRHHVEVNYQVAPIILCGHGPAATQYDRDRMLNLLYEAGLDVRTTFAIVRRKDGSLKVTGTPAPRTVHDPRPGGCCTVVG